ncbi:hypothetical protein MB27_35595 [Actinoplanes utahensis]|uniref:Uncharacterized protein n=1 Tax=Actinoplanes utahensis TaxID=1869 RepID=A0A0A6UGA4_ACTUT|nr:hypothetical protein MB27_35595 [Actinoplanes utahensis]
MFVRDRFYQLTSLAYYADGLITWGHGDGTDFAGLREALADGTLALAPPAGAPVHVPGLGGVTVTAEKTWWTVEALLGDIADEVDRLNDRPDSSHRAYQAFLDYAAAPGEATLEIARAAYHAVPEHRRIYMLGDMDQNDVPVRILLAEIGAEIPARSPGTTLTVTARSKDGALEYFRGQQPALDRWQARRTADGPEITAPLTIGRRVFPMGWPEDPGVEVLQTDYPAVVVHQGREYRSVAHAYWALSTSDPGRHDRIAAADRGFEAAALAAEAPRRDDWAAGRLAVMGALLRDKYRRHPALAATLLATGDARILSSGEMESRYWSTAGREGTNWVGRLLEVIRSELAASSAGLL